jgi:ABC-type multidrug transport system ATPase subunit/signal transduction histidine kinase
MLVIEEVSKRFGSISALSQVSFTARDGEVVALVGENGAGKSTLVRCVARALLPDEGRITLDGTELGRTPRSAVDQGLAVVWQDLALCENLDVTANLFLGREQVSRARLQGAAMQSRANRILKNLGLSIAAVDQPLDRLSGGQRQMVAIARAILDRPRVLILDEPTAALGVAESRTVLSTVKRLQASGVAILLISHKLDEVFDVADRIIVLRHGRLVADLHRAETHPDDVIALITGADAETIAGQQLRRLHSLAEQLSDAEQSSVLPLTVSSLSAAFDVDKLAVFLVEEKNGDHGGPPHLRRSAGLHLPPELESHLTDLPVGPGGGFLGAAADLAVLQLVPQLRDRPDDPVARLAADNGMSGAWAAPIVGQRGCLAVIAGFTTGVAQLQRDQIRLLKLFSTMAGSAIERGHLVDTLRSHNRLLSGLQGVLEALAGPELLSTAMDSALDALCRGVDADLATLLVGSGPDDLVMRAASCRPDIETDRVRTKAPAGLSAHVEAALGLVSSRAGNSRASGDGAEPGWNHQPPVLSVVEFSWSRGAGAVVCVGGRPGSETRQVVEGAAHSLRLALERELAADSEREAMALQQIRDTERALTRRLGHELRTPLTAIRGFASTMLQTDVEWGDDDKHRFLEIIESEAGRMARLVSQLFDDSAIESGTFRLATDYCDLTTIAERAISIVRAPGSVVADLPPSLTVWGDRDRLEQLLVNLIENAVRHNPDDTTITVSAGPGETPGRVRLTVSDTGRGLPDDVRQFYDGAIDELRGRGLGVRLSRSFVHAHHGTIVARTGPWGTAIDIDLLADQPLQEGDRT